MKDFTKKKKKLVITMIALMSVILSAVSWSVDPAVARLDERVLEDKPYQIAEPTMSVDAVQEAAQNEYEIRPGDTLSGIAASRRVSLEALAAANSLGNLDYIRAGQHIKLPAETITHMIQPGETLQAIAKRYNIDVYALAARNELTDADNIIAGRQLLIPYSAISLEAALPAAGGASLYQLAWPLLGVITSSFGTRDGKPHAGIDIAAEENTPILAAASGQVVFAGDRGTYGFAVIIDHGDGTRTLYAHCAKVLVTEGDMVTGGKTIVALVGSTGRSTGPHLHLEVLQNDVPLDPLTRLARRSYYG